ncbi:DUF58 domain-containing protein [Parasediminibacterium sp. JCM 36343]|uniref:DUF58 domain-containing protein n=1 Tax=Parasediminibacterium sp. JCM 36343 TaxID=3374279 RepID=UPI00397E7F65
MLKKLLYFFSFYFTRWFYIAVGLIVVVFVLAYFFPLLQQIATVALCGLSIVVLADAVLVFFPRKTVTATRTCADRFSNGDENKINLLVTNYLQYSINITIIDEIPFQFQQRSWQKQVSLPANGTTQVTYTLQPTERGAYHFGIINLFYTGPLNTIIRHVKTGEEKTIAVYPSYMQMKRFHLLAVTNQLHDTGSSRIRKIGHSLEFEQIKEYVLGDDYRNINWSATARKSSIMVNTFMDERSQQVICLIDKGRSMKMPFEGLTLLDYAINATLVLSNIVLLKQDKAGLITFGKKISQLVQPDRKPTQITTILETLYLQETTFEDSDFEALYSTVRYRVKQRSLLLLFTNFESMYGLERQLPYLQKLNTYHTLVVVFFKNTELDNLLHSKATNVEGIYTKTIAGQFAFEKCQIVKELNRHGIMALLTTPKDLTVNTLNKYLEIKARNLI